jgi:hypothetical protein
MGCDPGSNKLDWRRANRPREFPWSLPKAQARVRIPLSPPIFRVGQRDLLSWPQTSQREFRRIFRRYPAIAQISIVPNICARSCNGQPSLARPQISSNTNPSPFDHRSRTTSADPGLGCCPSSSVAFFALARHVSTGPRFSSRWRPQRSSSTQVGESPLAYLARWRLQLAERRSMTTDRKVLNSMQLERGFDCAAGRAQFARIGRHPVH